MPSMLRAVIHRYRAGRWLLVSGILIIIFLASSQPGENLTRMVGEVDFILSKSSHLIVFGALAVCLVWALDDRRTGILFLAWSFCVLFAITDEYHQLFVSGRGSWVVDIGIDSLGAFIGLVCVRLWTIRQTRDRSLRGY